VRDASNALRDHGFLLVRALLASVLGLALLEADLVSFLLDGLDALLIPEREAG